MHSSASLTRLVGAADCVDETTYKAQADALVDGGFRTAGYKTISIDVRLYLSLPAASS
jgi:hypothetical protein